MNTKEEQSLIRGKILGRMKGAPRLPQGMRPAESDPPCRGRDTENLVHRFTEEAVQQGCSVHLARSPGEIPGILSGLIAEEGISRLGVCDDEMERLVDAQSLSRSMGIEIVRFSWLHDRDSVREAAFGVDASVTWADMAVAESGTVVIMFRENVSRLLAVAPRVHIALVSTGMIVRDLEAAMAALCESGGFPSGEVCLITGPSSTSDIQAVHFKGMHGPARFIVVLYDYDPREVPATNPKEERPA